MQYGFAWCVVILAAWKSVDLIRWGSRAIKNILKGRGGDIHV